jgi:cystathionine beta-lyase family protein involved in aluminum resistance
VDPSITVTVDNCYGEFTETEEPGAAGADLVMGSLIKNPGGTIVTGEQVLYLEVRIQEQQQENHVCQSVTLLYRAKQVAESCG